MVKSAVPGTIDIGTLAEGILGACPEGILVCDGAARIVWANPAFLAMTGYGLPEVIGRTPRLLRSGFHDEGFYGTLWTALADAGSWHGEIWNRHKNGNVFPAWVTISLVSGATGDARYHVAHYTDLGDRQSRRRNLHRLAYFDAVTGLPNRNLFHDRLRQALFRAARGNALLAVLFLDLDGFKAINDTHGHATGDEVLRAVAERLTHCVREGDTLSRLGGDEFAAVLPDLADSGVAARVAERIVAALAEPLTACGGEVSLTASIGISLYPADGREAADLVRRADGAMYRAKGTRGSGYRFCGA